MDIFLIDLLQQLHCLFEKMPRMAHLKRVSLDRMWQFVFLRPTSIYKSVSMSLEASVWRDVYET